jgi:hypothetical protein
VIEEAQEGFDGYRIAAWRVFSSPTLLAAGDGFSFRPARAYNEERVRL